MARITLMDVAAKAGVALSTASKVMNGSGHLSDETIKHVLAVAEKLGYKPNRAAQLLSSKNKTIGILIPSEPLSVYSLFHDGIREAMPSYEDFGFRLECFHYSPDNDLAEVPERIEKLQHTINGLILIPSYHYKDYSETIRRLDVPKILLQTTFFPEFCPSVTVNERLVGEMAAEFLHVAMNHAEGRRKVAMIVGDRELTIHKRNIEGFIDGASRYPMEVAAVSESFDNMKTAYIQTRRLLETIPDLSGIFVSSYVSPGVCRCLRDEGLDGKIHVIGVDTTQENAELLQSGQLDALIYQNQKLQSATALDRLAASMRGETVANVKIKPELVMRSNLAMYVAD